MRILKAGLLAIACAVLARPALPAAGSCEGLAAMALPGATITLAEPIAAGAFAVPGGGRTGAAQSAAVKKLPAFCRVAATLKPTTDSEIKIEVWIPASNWNGKFLAIGNGGWTGSIAYPGMVDALGRGYATSSTDTGHAGGSGSFALGHPEKLVDFGYRAVHEMTIAAKAIVASYAGERPTFSYWSGCSAGGRQGLKEAQRFPADYDGIIAGAPASDWTGRAAQSLRVAQALHQEPASDIPPEKYPLIHDAVLEACDALDGVKDGVLENPRRCTFDPKVLQCRAGGTTACLTAAQVEAARQVYRTTMNTRTKREISGLERGSELGWATWGGPEPLGISYDHFKYVVFKDPKWDFRTFNFEKDIATADEIDADTINALDADLKAFFDRGGKLLQYHGWSDPQISPGNSVQYYSRVVEKAGGTQTIVGSYRLFMVPGMAHCAGGDGPDTFDKIGALEQWVEKNKAPDRIPASRVRNGNVDRTRPLCPYPQVSFYNGTGSPDEAGSFVCSAPRN